MKNRKNDNKEGSTISKLMKYNNKQIKKSIDNSQKSLLDRL